MSSRATLNETFAAKYIGVLPRTPYVRLKSEIYTPKRDDERRAAIIPAPFILEFKQPPPPPPHGLLRKPAWIAGSRRFFKFRRINRWHKYHITIGVLRNSEVQKTGIYLRII